MGLRAPNDGRCAWHHDFTYQGIKGVTSEIASSRGSQTTCEVQKYGLSLSHRVHKGMFYFIEARKDSCLLSSVPLNLQPRLAELRLLQTSRTINSSCCSFLFGPEYAAQIPYPDTVPPPFQVGPPEFQAFHLLPKPMQRGSALLPLCFPSQAASFPTLL